MTRTLLDELNDLHDAYASAINHAVEVDDLNAADDLARAYDDEAWELVAQWENKSHLLPGLRKPVYDTPLRRLVQRLKLSHAA